ncbi:Predicted arabinose efflux permease, MFS family [Rhizobiales bacterium GAS113]|jgi:FSR family fosmidomycin resistance protein-like MFS transporter|nr:Predicted arabinose efflux permease, MFS family [Rhizobiales bacterium GAS113]
MTDITLDVPRRDARVIGLIGAAHCSSHFFQLVLAPLFPLMKDDFGVDFVKLASILTVFYSVSAIAQVVAGFIVDRFGAQRVLPVGIACLGLSTLGIGFAQSYWMLLPLAALGGIGNSVFHPADYSVLTARVTPSRLARAYSVHTVSGTVGWAVAPITMLTLSQWLGWRGALMAVGVLGLILAAFIASEHSELTSARHGHPAAKRGGANAKMLFTLPILMAFLYFTLLAAAGGATQNFFPTMLPQVQGVTLTVAAIVTTAYLASSAFGSFAGGYLADMTRDHERVIGAGLIGAAALALLIGFVPMSDILVFAAAIAMGFVSGLTIPSRDMLVRAATPPGATGKVFGFVYSGLDLGSLVAPVVVGALIDRGQTPYAFAFIAAALAATVGAAVAVKHNRYAG